MITVSMNESQFEYDIHSLLREFFPKEEVKFCVEKEREEGTVLHLNVEYEEDKITIAVLSEEETWQQEVKIDQCERKEVKNRLKRLLYQMMKEKTAHTLPWGTLSGIRPTKIVLNELLQGASEEETAQMMRECYYASEDKIKLSMEIAKREKQLLEQTDYEDGYSIYIGIPFCPSTCLYCSFPSNPLGRWEKRMGEYLTALEKEIDFFKEKMSHKRLNTIYIGGGTPTTLSPEQLQRLIYKLKTSFDLTNLKEFTIEAGRPDSITREKLRVLKQEEIGRISINPQTMKQKTLDIIGRWHTVEQTEEAFYLARELGFDTINMDMIVGLPNEDEQDVRDTLEALKRLAPDNLTVHSLAIKRAAKLQMFKEEYVNLKSENSAAIMNMTQDYAQQMGMSPYYLYRQKNMTGNMENVGYATPGKAGLYNVLIMEERQTILAMGAAASTKIVYQSGEVVKRVENVKDVELYLTRIDEMIEKKYKALVEAGVCL
ncbi:MAG: coproporphyrinogen dehydrogenase HemZ [Lachnospiraceae bacterium]